MSRHWNTDTFEYVIRNEWYTKQEYQIFRFSSILKMEKGKASGCTSCFEQTLAEWKELLLIRKKFTVLAFVVEFKRPFYIPNLFIAGFAIFSGYQNVRCSRVYSKSFRPETAIIKNTVRLLYQSKYRVHNTGAASRGDSERGSERHV